MCGQTVGANKQIIRTNSESIFIPGDADVSQSLDTNPTSYNFGPTISGVPDYYEAEGDCSSGCSSWFQQLLAGDCWLDLDAAYRGEVFSNVRGGADTNSATSYTGRLDVLLKADLEKAGMSPGGVFVLHFQSLHGEGITDRYVGAQQRISNIDGNPGAAYNLTQLSQYWWQRGFADE